MLVPDVNVLIYAHRTDSCDDHEAYASWLTKVATGHEPFALSTLGLSGLVRIVTNPRIFRRPSTLDEVFAFVNHPPGTSPPRDLRRPLPPIGGHGKVGGGRAARCRCHRARVRFDHHRLRLRSFPRAAVAPPAARALTAAGSATITVRRRARIRWSPFSTLMSGSPEPDAEKVSGNPET
jgi:predicted nucleic acid-binding protein